MKTNIDLFEGLVSLGKNKELTGRRMWEEFLPKEGSDQTGSQIVGPPSAFITRIKWATGVQTRK